jgi:hypothetical protein
MSDSPSVSSISIAQQGYNSLSNVRALGFKGPNVEDVAQLNSVPVQNLSEANSYANVNKVGYKSSSVAQIVKEANNSHLSLASLKNNNEGAILLGVDKGYKHAVKIQENLVNNGLDSYYKDVQEKLHPKLLVVEVEEPYHRELTIVSTLPQRNQ